MSDLSFKLILRKLWTDSVYTLVKILGLAVGMACALLAILFVRDEQSFDRFHAKGDRLYRITTITNNPLGGGSEIMGATGQVEGPAFKNKIPEIEDYVRVLGGLSTNFIVNRKALTLNFIYTDEGFFNDFSFPFTSGSPAGSLKDPNSVVLTAEAALKFFGRTDVVGQTIQLEEGQGMATFVITGVAKNPPLHSSIQFEAVLPFGYLQKMFNDKNWLNSYLSTFVLLRENADIDKIEGEFGKIFREEAAEQLRGANMRADQLQFGLQPLPDIHLNIFPEGHSPIVGRGNLNERSTLTYSYILSGIAGLILIMAIINFLNLSLAGSIRRSKEIAIRKVSGGSRRQIAGQFLAESSVLCIAAYVLAIGFVMVFLPVFNRLAQKSISLLLPSDLLFFLYGLILITFCVLLIGLYPAIKLSLFNPVEILFNKQKIGGRNVFNRSLIVVQFTFAISLLITTIIYYRQMNFISRSDLGYEPSDVVRVHLPNFRGIDRHTIETLRSELTAEPSIIQVANGDLPPVGGNEEVEIGGNKFSPGQISVDQFFVGVSGIQVREGRDFSSGFERDTINSMLINETFVRQAGLEHPIGQRVTFVDSRGVGVARTIVGVVKDFHYGSLKEKIQPVALVLRQSEYIWIKLRRGNPARALSHLESTFRASFPAYFYEYAFLGDEVKEQYADDERWKQVVTDAAGLAIFICCLGLMGLVHFEVMRRAKEMNVRKVLGSSVVNILLLLSRDFVRLVLLSMVIGAPIAWYTMYRWLNNFSYRIRISWVDFAAGAVVVLVVTLVTVNIRVFRAAIVNPVEYLRSE